MRINKVFIYIFFSLILSFSFISVFALDESNLLEKNEVEIDNIDLNTLSIENIKVIDKSGTVDVDNLNVINNIITSDIIFNEVDDFINLELDIKNNSNIIYKLKAINNQIEDNYLIIDSTSIGNSIRPNNIEKIYIKIKYNNLLINQLEKVYSNCFLTLQFEKDNTIINPPTSGSNYFLIKLLLIFNIIVSGTYLIKKRKIFSFILLFLLLPLYVFAEENTSVTLGFRSIKIEGILENYTISIDDSMGNITTINRDYGTTIGDLYIPNRSGYNFLGWVDSNNNSVSNNTVVTGDLVISALYEIINYTISYQLDGGVLENNNPSNYTVEDQFILNNPTKEGYTFAGWREEGSSALKTSLTIFKGSTGNKSYIAVFSPNQNTSYTVIHRIMNMNGEYEVDEVENLTGATDSEVTPDRKNYTGFIIPPEQTKVILANGSTTFTYDYERKQFSFAITDRSDIDNTSTPDGTYYYDTVITIKANEKAGYTFKWSDNNTDYVRSFHLASNISLTPLYTANTNTPYKVIHKTMDLNGTTYSVRDTQNKTGETNTSVTPPVNTYEGFTAPSTKTVLIKGDGTTEVIYLYSRNKYTLTLQNEDYIETDTPSGNYYYGTSITLTAKERDHYSFSKWSNENTSLVYTFELTSNITIGPIYTLNDFVIDFNPNGGSVSPEFKTVTPGEEIGELPIPTKSDSKYFLGWYTSLTDGVKVTEHYVPEGDIVLYAKWLQTLTSTFKEGYYVSAYMKRLAGNSEAQSNTEDHNILAIKRANQLLEDFSPNPVNTISTEDSYTPIYMWYHNTEQAIYYYSDADVLYLNPVSNLMFANMQNLQSIEDIETWDASLVENMDSMFAITGSDADSFTIDLSSWDTSNVVNMTQLFYSCGYASTTWSIGDLSEWNVSSVENMTRMFKECAIKVSSWSVGDLSEWNVSNVVGFVSMFETCGYTSTTWSVGDLSEWNIVSATDLNTMFGNCAYSVATFNIGNLSNWNLEHVVDTHRLFANAGYSATSWYVGDLSDWDVSQVVDMESMFLNCGINATTWSIGDLSGWITSNVTNMSQMFANVGKNVAVWSLGNLSEWNTSKVTSFANMFYSAGNQSSTFDLGDLDNWNVSNVTTMVSMFQFAGQHSATWNIGKLDNWDTRKVTDMSGMFLQITNGSSELVDLGVINVYADTVYQMFWDAENITCTVNIRKKPTNYLGELNGDYPYGMFYYAARFSPAQITVNYTAEVDNIDDIIATKGVGHVYKGELLTS